MLLLLCWLFVIFWNDVFGCANRVHTYVSSDDHNNRIGIWVQRRIHVSDDSSYVSCEHIYEGISDIEIYANLPRDFQYNDVSDFCHSPQI